LPRNFISISSTANSNVNTGNINTFDLAELEKQTIIKALQKVNYNKAEAARLLNLEWNALYRRIQKHNIDLPTSFK
jgi:DNA-binding NtrC family response regulator